MPKIHCILRFHIVDSLIIKNQSGKSNNNKNFLKFILTHKREYNDYLIAQLYRKNKGVILPLFSYFNIFYINEIHGKVSTY